MLKISNLQHSAATRHSRTSTVESTSRHLVTYLERAEHLHSSSEPPSVRQPHTFSTQPGRKDEGAILPWQRVKGRELEKSNSIRLGTNLTKCTRVILLLQISFYIFILLLWWPWSSSNTDLHWKGIGSYKMRKAIKLEKRCIRKKLFWNTSIKIEIRKSMPRYW